MSDVYGNVGVSWSKPAIRHAFITPSDSVDISPVPRALRIGNISGGTDLVIDILNEDGVTIDTVTYEGLEAGEVLDIRAKRVRATGTLVTNIVAWW